MFLLEHKTLQSANQLGRPGSDGRRPLQDVSGVVENLFCSVLSGHWQPAALQSARASVVSPGT